MFFIQRLIEYVFLIAKKLMQAHSDILINNTSDFIILLLRLIWYISYHIYRIKHLNNYAYC